VRNVDAHRHAACVDAPSVGHCEDETTVHWGYDKDDLSYSAVGSVAMVSPQRQPPPPTALVSAGDLNACRTLQLVAEGKKSGGESRVSYVHTTTLTGLSHATRYWYRIGAPENADCASAVYDFKTPPAPGSPVRTSPAPRAALRVPRPARHAPRPAPERAARRADLVCGVCGLWAGEHGQVPAVPRPRRRRRGARAAPSLRRPASFSCVFTLKL